MEAVRVDKYLWAIRIFKTRTLATEACKSGRVKLKGTSVKPSHEVKIGEEFTIQRGQDKKVVEVTGLLANRVDAKKAVLYYADHSPVDPREVHPTVFLTGIFRERGAVRPTKKERRDLDDLRSED